MERDLTHPSQQDQQKTHKLKRLIPAPNSFFLEVRCSGCGASSTLFSHAQSVVACNSCRTVIAKPTGGKCQLTYGTAFKVRS